MNQAQSRRLRTRCFLLLSLLLASTPRVSLASSVTTGFEVSGLASPVPLGLPITVTVTAQSTSGVDTGYAGTIRFSSTAPLALLPADYTFIPAVDHGTKTFLITFQSLGQWELLVQDVNTLTLYSSIPIISVTPGPPTHFAIEITGALIAGNSYSFTVIPLDAGNNRTSYTGKLHFATTVARATFQPDFDGTVDQQQQFPITFFSADPNPKTLTVTAPDNPLLTGSATIVVSANVFQHVELSTTAPTLAPTCTDTTIVMTAEDAWDNPVSLDPPSTVTLCAPSGRSASFVTTTLNPYTSSGSCVTGTLESTAQAVWKDQVEEDVEFTLSGISAKAPLTIHWKNGIPSPLTSNFSFSESAADPAPLLIHSGQLTAQLTLRDQCGNPATLPPTKSLSFAADPLLALTPAVEERPGRWTTSVSLPECPADPSKRLAVWPLINNELLKKPNGEQVQRFVLPQCSTVVQLALLSPAESLVAEPGQLVEFEVQVSNDGDLPVSNGVLMQEPTGLTVLGASIAGQALPAKGAGFELPELRKGSPLTVKVTAQATTQLSPSVNTKVWVANPDGIVLTQKQSVDFQRKDLGVDVGCGCHAASLPSQLGTWLVLLLVASRPWGGLRRLRRGERIDH